MIDSDDARNLLAETIEDLASAGLGPSDVQFVRMAWGKPLQAAWFTWDEFAELADREYDADYGWPEVVRSLKIVGKHWWLERHEYDGKEWWEYKTLPGKPATHQVPPTVIDPDAN